MAGHPPIYEFFGVERESRTSYTVPMSDALQILTEKEKQTLRLMGRGHDAKSMARDLGLSVHTINERLGEARRKLSVSSSREAARLLLDSEADAPDCFGDRFLGEAATHGATAEAAATIEGRPRRTPWILAGVLLMSLIALAALALQPQPAAAPTQPVPASQTQAEVTRAARDWLALVEAGRMEESWRGTSQSFRELNSLEAWTRATQAVRTRYGAVISRTDLSVESIPVPPAGAEMVKFRTRYANGEATETITLGREGGAWKVLGIWVE